MNKDLFGNAVADGKSDAALYVHEKDKVSISSHAQRLEYLQKIA